MRIHTMLWPFLACTSCIAIADDEPNNVPNGMEYPYFAKQFPDSPPPSSDLGKRLYDAGLTYRGLALVAAFNNVTTGARPGHVGGQAIFINAFDLDLGKLVDLPDNYIHIEGVVFPWHYPRDDRTEFGSFASSYLGGDQYPSHAPGFDPWLSLLTYERVMLDGSLQIEVGKTNLQRYFFSPNCGVDFLCTDSLVKWNTGVPDASTGSLGGRVRYKLDANWAVEAGAQQMREYSSLIHKRGWDAFGAGGGTGTFYAASLSYDTSFMQSAYPQRYQLNAFYADAEISDPLDPSDTHQGSGGVVFKHQRTLWSSTGQTAQSPTDVPSHLSWFGTLEHSGDGAKPVAWGVTQGLTWAKPLGEKDGVTIDQATFKVMYLHLNESTLQAQRNLRMSLGGSDRMTQSDTWRLELSTTVGVTPRLKIQPAVEYIINPDSAMSRDSPELPRSGWLVGATLALSLGNVP